MITNTGAIVLGVDADTAERVRAAVLSDLFREEIVVRDAEGVRLEVRRLCFYNCSCGARFAVYAAGLGRHEFNCSKCDAPKIARTLAKVPR